MHIGYNKCKTSAAAAARRRGGRARAPRARTEEERCDSGPTRPRDAVSRIVSRGARLFAAAALVRVPFRFSRPSTCDLRRPRADSRRSGNGRDTTRRERDTSQVKLRSSSFFFPFFFLSPPPPFFSFPSFARAVARSGMQLLRSPARQPYFRDFAESAMSQPAKRRRPGPSSTRPRLRASR
ncbi:hypothetical protein PUN28_002600 [Cardiocondyla obscurior]|uniref:Uncharacterized protein n=1 Tax=Cardiocondyla obscurior TaxID=286306 RepID=A0AAW2GV91_9HYME